MEKSGRSERWLHFLEKYPDTRIENLFDTFLKLLFFIINSPFIHICFASFSLLVEVILWVLKNTILVLLPNVMKYFTGGIILQF